MMPAQRESCCSCSAHALVKAMQRGINLLAANRSFSKGGSISLSSPVKGDWFI